MEQRKAYEARLAAQLEEWRAMVALFKAKADKASAEAKLEYCELAAALQRKQDKARVLLTDLQAAGSDAWEELKTGADKAWTEIGAAFHNAASKLRK